MSTNEPKKPNHEEDEDTHFVDRRRFHDDEAVEGEALGGPGAVGAAESVEVDAAASEVGESARQPRSDRDLREPRAPEPPRLTELPDVYTLLEAYIGTLGSQAFVWLGLLKDPISNKMAKDLAQAKVAIDTCEAMIKQLMPIVGESEKRELQRLLDDLRINFVNQSAAGG